MFDLATTNGNPQGIADPLPQLAHVSASPDASGHAAPFAAPLARRESAKLDRPRAEVSEHIFAETHEWRQLPMLEDVAGDWNTAMSARTGRGVHQSIEETIDVAIESLFGDDLR